ncbi:hypothetical protein B0A49_12582, partial [Cryomyces minteri]
MSGDPSARPSTTAERRTSASLRNKASRPRVASANTADQENADNPQLRKPSASSTINERRTEKSYVSTRETMSVRTRSPLKPTERHASTRRSKDKDAETAHRASEAIAEASGTKKSGSEVQWNPTASLVPHTTAPLASRISVPPMASLAPQSLQPRPLNQLSLSAQEAAIIEDLLFVFMGFEGQYIRFVDSYRPLEEKDRLAGPQFRILPGLDPSLFDLAQSMLKMATHYCALESFVEVQSRGEFGAVNHALCAAIRKLLKDYLVLMAQLEHQMLTNPGFTLHVLSLHTKPTTHMLFQLYSVAHEILRENSMLEENLDDELDDSQNFDNILESLREGKDAVQEKKVCKGGSVLRLITRRLASMSGDPAAATLLTTLLREASRPYMALLNEWLHHGGIKDPHEEFLIKEQKSIKRERLEQDYTDEYWEKRYTVRNDVVPPQLEGVKDKVLLAGKYLNVVRECGGVDISKSVTSAPTTFDDPRFLDNVNGAYAHANSSLLNLLLTTHVLPARLRSLKHYFFLDRSDFFTYFLEISTSELKKPVKSVNISKLQSLLDIVLHQAGSVAAEDPFKEDVKVSMNEISLTNWLMGVVNTIGIDQDMAAASANSYTPATQSSSVGDDKNITGFEALVLDYVVPFPLSLVVSRVTLIRYQLLFRYLLSLRHLETLLIGSWTDHSKLTSWRHKSSNPKIEMWKRRAWTLRARMLVFVQQLLYFCTAEVIEPNWQKFMSRLNAGEEEEISRVGEVNEEIPSQPKRTVDELMQDHMDFLAT